MDILFLNWKDLANPDVGGAEIIIYELAKRLVDHGHTVTWFCRSFDGAEPESVVDGIRVIRRGNRFTVYLEAYLYYRSLAVKPDRVVDCVNTIAWQTPLYVPKEKRIAYVNQLAKEVLYYELLPVVSRIAYALEPLEYLTYRNTRFLCYSESVKKDITTFGIPEKNISTFPIGIDHTRYKPGIKSKDPLFLFVARITAMKRPDLCIDAMRIVCHKYPKAKLVLVGYGPMEKQLAALIKQNNLEGNVSIVNTDHLFFDTNPKDQKVMLMQQSWALLLPSVKEGWGMVVTEAAACGTPAIVTRVTGLQDSVLENYSGLFLSKNPTSRELAGLIIDMIQNHSLRSKLSDQAIRYSRKFTWDNSYSAFAQLLAN